MLIKVKNSVQFNELIKEHRRQGYNLITLGNKLAELEKGDNKVIIVIKKGDKA